MSLAHQPHSAAVLTRAPLVLTVAVRRVGLKGDVFAVAWVVWDPTTQAEIVAHRAFTRPENAGGLVDDRSCVATKFWGQCEDNDSYCLSTKQVRAAFIDIYMRWVVDKGAAFVADLNAPSMLYFLRRCVCDVPEFASVLYRTSKIMVGLDTPAPSPPTSGALRCTSLCCRDPLITVRQIVSTARTLYIGSLPTAV